MGISPSEFWDMTLPEILFLIMATAERQERSQSKVPHFTQDEIAEMLEFAHGTT